MMRQVEWKGTLQREDDWFEEADKTERITRILNLASKHTEPEIWAYKKRCKPRLLFHHGSGRYRFYRLDKIDLPLIAPHLTPIRSGNDPRGYDFTAYRFKGKAYLRKPIGT